VTDFPALLRRLVEAEVEFIVVGGAAATAHGSPRLTLDLDIVYRRASQNIQRLVAALGPCRPYLRGAPPGLPFQWDQQSVQRGFNFTLTTTLGNIDLFGEITAGGGYEDILPHTVFLEVFGMQCRCLSLQRLIEVKRATGRPKDLEGLAELELILEQQRGD